MEQINFLSKDKFKLNGFLYQSDNKTSDIILSIHGMSSNCFKNRDNVISKEANQNNIDYFCFNNRGSELVRYLKNEEDSNKTTLAGTSYEDVLNGYEDIVGAIQKLKELGYSHIHLQGHSLGCTKIVHTYNKLKQEKNSLINTISSVILLSYVDIPRTLEVYLGNNYNYYLNYANQKEAEGKNDELMPKEAFIHPISVKTFLRYIRDNNEIQIDNYKKVDNIDVPLFMRWGTENEMIIETPNELVAKVSGIIKNKKKDISYIQGADHSYSGKESELAKQIINFIKNIF